MLWCAKCSKDFIPSHNGIFDGPVPVNVCNLMGIKLEWINLDTKEIIGVDNTEFNNLN